PPVHHARGLGGDVHRRCDRRRLPQARAAALRAAQGGMKAILTDIEGTTSSIDFVHRTLFPYARANLRDFLQVSSERPEARAALDEVEAMEGRRLSVEQAAGVLERWIDEDRKVTPLKALQGMIWKVGYENGGLKGHVYPDTPGQLRRWHDAGL